MTPIQKAHDLANQIQTLLDLLDATLEPIALEIMQEIQEAPLAHREIILDKIWTLPRSFHRSELITAHIIRFGN